MRFLFLLLSTFLSYFTASAQNPIEADSTVHDTVIVYRDPHVIKKTVHVQKNKTARTRKSFTGIEVGGSVFNSYYYSKVCEECVDYYDSLKKFRAPSLSYSLSLQVNHYRKGFFFHSGISYISYQEKLNYFIIPAADSAYKRNRLDYIDIQIGAGYTFSTKYFHIIPEGAFIFSKQLARTGHTLEQNTNGQLLLLKNDDRFEQQTYKVMAGCRFMFLPGKRLRPSIEPFYTGDLKSLTDKTGQYTLYRNSTGLKIFLCLFL